MKKHLLIVEDDRTTWASLRDVLGTDTYELEWVQTGHEAVRRSLDSASDIIVLDTALLDVDGWKVLDCLCRLHPFVAIIALVKNLEESELGVLSGASACLLKPVGPRALFKAVQRLLAEPSQERVWRSMELRSRLRLPETEAALCA
jgi:twitching motility two-component system response regulator PilG